MLNRMVAGAQLIKLEKQCFRCCHTWTGVKDTRRRFPDDNSLEDCYDDIDEDYTNEL